MSGFRTTLLLALTAMCLSAYSARSYAATLDAKLTFANLPATITLCRDSVAVANNNGWDEQWAVLIDIDGNPLTGEPTTGAEFVLVAQTIPQANPCVPNTVNTADALISAVLAWDGSTFAQTVESPNVTLDFVAHTMTLSADTSGALSGITSASNLEAQAYASYKPSGSPVALAYDSVAYTPVGTPVTDPSGNVQGCSSPCSAAAPYYPIIDIVGFDPGSITGFGANVLTFEFDLAGLPANIGLCRYPAAFFADLQPGQATVDSLWVSQIDLNHDGVYDVAVFAYTTPQLNNCSSHTAPIETSLFAELDTIDPALGLVLVSSLPVSVDTASGRITIQAPRNDPAFTGLSGNSVVLDTANGYYAANFTVSQDPGSTFNVGRSFIDAKFDATNCSGNCSTGQSWYPQVDLIGGTVYGPNIIFRNGFE